MNMGGPDSLEAVPQFMRNLFLDPDIFRFPMGWATRPLFAWMLTKLRTKKVRAAYERIGGSSPQLALTKAQAEALRANLSRRGIDILAAPAMRYWRPTIGQAIDDLIKNGATKLIALPLYPHFSFATTGSSLHELDRCLRDRSMGKNYALIEPYFDRSLYIDALAEHIEEGLGAFGAGEKPQALVSAHGLPQSFVDRGDPYVGQIETTFDLLRRRFPEVDFHLSYQSRVGPVKWIGPSTVMVVKDLGLKGLKQLLVVPVSFVSDHIETLYEIDVELAETARQAGIEEFRRMRSLNVSETFIDLLAELAIEALEVD